jgi:rhodanese-related sulfurtransferase
MRILTTCLVLLAFVCGASGATAQTAKTTVGEVSREELMSRPPERFLILDVRTPEEFAARPSRRPASRSSTI